MGIEFRRKSYSTPMTRSFLRSCAEDCAAIGPLESIPLNRFNEIPHLLVLSEYNNDKFPNNVTSIFGSRKSTTNLQWLFISSNTPYIPPIQVALLNFICFAFTARFWLILSYFTYLPFTIRPLKHPRMPSRSELTPALRERICELHSAVQWGYKRIQCIARESRLKRLFNLISPLWKALNLSEFWLIFWPSKSPFSTNTDSAFNRTFIRPNDF